MAEWRYLTHDLLTNAQLAELPLSGVSFNSVLNGVGDFSGSLSLSDSRIAQLSPLDATAPARTALYVEVNGVLVWGGVLWSRRFDKTSDSWNLGAKEFLSYFDRRRIRARLAYKQVDQCSIIRSVVSWAQAQPAGNIGVLFDVVASGVKRDRTYEAFALTNVLAAIQEFTTLSDGFDIAIDPFYDSDGNPAKRLNLGWRQRGVIAGLTGLVLDDRTAGPWAWPEDGGQMRTVSYATGAGQGSTMGISVVANPALHAAGYPLLEGDTSYNDVLVKATLDSHARGDLFAFRGPVVLPVIPLHLDGNVPLGSYSTGDVVRVELSGGNFPGGMYVGFQRIQDIRVEASAETATLTMGDVIL